MISRKRFFVVHNVKICKACSLLLLFSKKIRDHFVYLQKKKPRSTHGFSESASNKGHSQISFHARDSDNGIKHKYYKSVPSKIHDRKNSVVLGSCMIFKCSIIGRNTFNFILTDQTTLIRVYGGGVFF